jgi:cytoskeletal protein CcmA (bactofilin family)
MALWKDSSPKPTTPDERPRFLADVDPSPAAETKSMSNISDASHNESLIAADLTIEGKIHGSGHVRLAGKFKGDVDVQGDLTVEAGATLTGGVRAKKVVIAGEVQGNIDATSVELLKTGVLNGDLKAASLTVAAGSRMRGQVEFGWNDAASSTARKSSRPEVVGESSQAL